MMNKFAQLMSNLLIQSYGLSSPSTLLPSLLTRIRSPASTSSSETLNPVSTDMVLRLLHEASVQLGSDITVRAGRSRERILRDTAVRDEIRSSHAIAIASTVWKIVEEGLSKIQSMRTQEMSTSAVNGQGWNLEKAIGITCEAITVIGDYASWIDIGLIVTPQTVPLLYALLQQDIFPLRIAATDTLLEIAIKGMKPEDKIELLGVLNLTLTVSELEKATRQSKSLNGDMSEDVVTVREHLAKLANGVTLEYAKILELAEASNAIKQLADKSLLTFLNLVLDFLTDEWDEVTEAVLPCISVTLTIYKRLKRNDKSAAPGNPNANGIALTIYSQEKADFLARLMGVILVKLKFDDDQEWNGGGGVSRGGSDDEDSDDEDVARFLQLRKVSATLLYSSCCSEDVLILVLYLLATSTKCSCHCRH